MDRRHKLAPEDRQTIIRRRRAGESAALLASEFGISRKTVDEMCQESLRSRAKLSRRQLNHYLKELGITPPNVELLLAEQSGRATPKDRLGEKGVKRRRLTKEQWKVIDTRCESGEDIGKVAAEFGVSPATVRTHLHRAARAEPPLVPMTLEHLRWLETQMLVDGRPGRRRWKPSEVREMLMKKFGQRVSLRTHQTQLFWMGLDGPGKKTMQTRRAELRRLKVELAEKHERLVLEALAAGKLEPLVRGRPKNGP